MFRKASSLTLELRELPYGSVWLVGDGDGNPSHLSPLAMHALSTADAVIHDLGVSQKFLDLVKSSHYRETGAPRRAIGRAIQLAQDGWRVVHLVKARPSNAQSNAPPAAPSMMFPSASCPTRASRLGARRCSGFFCCANRHRSGALILAHLSSWWCLLRRWKQRRGASQGHR